MNNMMALDKDFAKMCGCDEYEVELIDAIDEIDDKLEKETSFYTRVELQEKKAQLLKQREEYYKKREAKNETK